MATPTLIATPGASNANSYATVAEADAYFDGNLYNTTWVAADPSTTKIVALIMATRVLDVMYDWKGFPTTPSIQALQWPRVGLFQRNRIALVDQTTIPQELKNAVAELAQQLITENRTADSDIERYGLTQMKAGPIDMTLKHDVFPKVIPDAVYFNLVPWWGDLRSRVTSTREVARA